jgi:hypothetical protein
VPSRLKLFKGSAVNREVSSSIPVECFSFLSVAFGRNFFARCRSQGSSLGSGKFCPLKTEILSMVVSWRKMEKDF